MSRPWPGTDPVDRFALRFGILLALVVGARTGSAATAALLAAANVALAVAARRLLPGLRSGTGVRRFFGLGLPLLVFYAFYRELGLVMRRPDTAFHDVPVAALEWEGWVRMNALAAPPAVGEFMAFAYMAYVPLILAVLAGLAPLGRGASAPAETLVRRICFCWAGCYIVFASFPVLGPHWVFDAMQSGRLGNGPFSALALFNQQHGMLRGAAFPSAHIAATVLTVGSALRWLPRAGVIVVPLAAALSASTMYLGYHYVIDVLAGATAAAAALAADRRLARGAPAAASSEAPVAAP